MMKKKPYILKDKILAEKHLVARLELLKSNGTSDRDMQRDVVVRHFKGEIRRAKGRLACIAVSEELNARKLEIKAEKLATPKDDQPKKRHTADPGKKKAKSERKPAPVEADED